MYLITYQKALDCSSLLGFQLKAVSGNSDWLRSKSNPNIQAL